VIRASPDEADQHNAAASQLIQALGAKRFEAQVLGMNALAALTRGDRSRARDTAGRALAICREHGMGHIGPWLFGVSALIETDTAARVRLLDEGERQLALGCVSHNHIQMREFAIDVLLEIGDFEGVAANCERIRSYTAGEPLPTSEFVIARGLALARHGQGERSEALRESLQRLHSQAVRAELNRFIPRIENALGQFDAA